MKRLRVLKTELSTGPYKSFVEEICTLAKKGRSSYVCVANVHMTIEAYNSGEYSKIVNSAALVSPDGMPLVKMLKMLYGIRQERIAGMDLLPSILQRASEEDIGIYLYGSTEEVLKKIRRRTEDLYKQLKISGMRSPPFRKLTVEEEQKDVEEIRRSGAGIVMVALGCPKQEKWMHKFSDKIPAVLIGLGGAFPVFAGVESRAPEWMQRLSLEWLFRLIREPRRLWRRYLYTNSKFLILAIREIIRKRVLKRT